MVFLLYLATMMLPSLVMMIPNYQNMISLGLVNTLQGLILPSAFSAFGTFLIRQFMMNIPSSLDEAAEIDGASKWQLYWTVILPLARPAIVTLTIFTFIGNYNSMFWPLVMIKSPELYTLPIGMLAFDSSQGDLFMDYSDREGSEGSEILRDIAAFDTDSSTPLEALMFLSEIKKRLGE